MRAAEREPVGRGERGAEHLRRAPLQHVSRLVAHFLCDGGKRGALHLAQLDRQQLEKVTVGVRGGGAPSLRRAHQPLRDVETDRPLARRRPRRGVDGGDARSVEDSADQDREVAEVPGREMPVFAEDVERFVLGRAGHALSRCRAARGASAAPTRPTRLQPGADFFGLGVAGHDGDASLQLGPPRLDREVEREAGHRGEMDIEQQGVRLLAAEEVVGLFRGRHRQHAVPVASQRPFQHATQRRLIVDDENGDGVAGLRTRGHEAATLDCTAGARNRRTTMSRASSGLSDRRISPAVRPR